MTMVMPLADRVLVRRAEAEKMTPSGIVLPPVAQKKSQRAVVVAVGPGRVLDNGSRLEPRVKKDDVVLLGEWAGTEIRIDDIEHLMVREDELLGIYED